MEEAIRAAIERQARKLLKRDEKKLYTARGYQRRFKLRTGEQPTVGTHRPSLTWQMGARFNPRYCIKHSKYLAKTLWKKILHGEYEVEPAVLYKIPKDTGGHREVMVFTIPDAAIANLFNRKLRDRNRNILSPFCYSYRKDRGIFDAVIQLSSLLKNEKVYVVQFDFSKYFDSIKHDYIKFIFEKDFFVISPTEQFIVSRFLEHRYAEPTDYRKGVFEKRRLGVPQGSSISLFLSNIAAHELDRQLEKSNGMFVRFADDVVCVAYNHDDALNVVEQFRQHCKHSGITINYEKSPGIALLKPASNHDKRIAFVNSGDLGRIKVEEEFDYVGHKFTKDHVLMSSRGVRRIKRRISELIYIHLLHNPRKRKKFSPNRVGGLYYDWDLVTCINEIRRYINGGLLDQRLKDFLERNDRIRKFKGLMSFYPLVTTVKQFSELDGWLISVLRRAVKERSKILKRDFNITLNPLSSKAIIDGTWYQFGQGIKLETNAPSFVLAWRAARKSFKQYGLIDFEQPSYYSSAFFSVYDD